MSRGLKLEELSREELDVLTRLKRMSVEKRLLYWMTERESIRIARKNRLSKPWTDNPILRRYRFCNVRRMDDRVSHWLLKNWYEPYRDHPNMLAACALARHFNKIQTLEAVGFPKIWNRPVLESRVRSVVKPFNSAYIVSGGSVKSGGYSDKVEMVIDRVISPLMKDPPLLNFDSMQESVEALKTRAGFGWFMAGQVIADMRWAVTGRWKDRKVWAPMGPGSHRGINRLFGRDPGSHINQAEFLRELSDVIKLCKSGLPHSITGRLEAIDYQNCLCELDKSERVLQGQGAPKSRYHGM